MVDEHPWETLLSLPCPCHLDNDRRSLNSRPICEIGLPRLQLNGDLLPFTFLFLSPTPFKPDELRFKGQTMHFNNATGSHPVFGASNKLGFLRVLAEFPNKSDKPFIASLLMQVTWRIFLQMKTQCLLKRCIVTSSFFKKGNVKKWNLGSPDPDL